MTKSGLYATTGNNQLNQEKDKTYIQFLDVNRNNEELSTKGKMLEGAIQILKKLLEEV